MFLYYVQKWIEILNERVEKFQNNAGKFYKLIENLI